MSKAEMIELMHTIYKAAHTAWKNSKVLTESERDYMDRVYTNAALIAARLATDEEE